MKNKKLRPMVAGVLAALTLGSTPAAHAVDNLDASDAGRGGLAAGVGLCNVLGIQLALVGDAGCAVNGVADASGGDVSPISVIGG